MDDIRIRDLLVGSGWSGHGVWLGERLCDVLDWLGPASMRARGSGSGSNMAIKGPQNVAALVCAFLTVESHQNITNEHLYT